MPLYKFKQSDVLHNTIKVHPQNQFFIFDRKLYYNLETPEPGVFIDPVKHVPQGHLSLYELNIDRPPDPDPLLVYPFVNKGGNLLSFKTVSGKEFWAKLWGDKASNTYPLSASLSIDRLDGDHVRIGALKNTINYYAPLSRHYVFNSPATELYRDFGDFTKKTNLISIPSIFYGSSIKKGSIELNFYITGTLLAQLRDEKRNGELIQTAPVGSSRYGCTEGIVLYNEGFLLLTGSDFLHAEHKEKYDGTNLSRPVWNVFGTTGSSGANGQNVVSSSFAINFSGSDYINTITMLAHASKGELNHSNNPTYLKSGSVHGHLNPHFSPIRYKEDETLQIKNVVSSSYADPTGSFQKTTYISKIGIYDKDKNLIAITKLASPIKKSPNRDFTFKLKLDI